MMVHQQPRLLYVASLLAVWSAFWICIVFVGMIAALTAQSPYVSAVALPAFVVGMFLFLPIALVLRCPTCRRRLLIQGRSVGHPEAPHWVAVAWKIVRTGQFTCLHCGAQCALKA